MKSLFDLMNAERKPIALFGGMCTTVNEPVAMATKYWNILQLSYAETHAKFSSADSNEVCLKFFWVFYFGKIPALPNVLSDCPRRSMLKCGPMSSYKTLQLDSCWNNKTERQA